jgi:hypothetical protein
MSKVSIAAATALLIVSMAQVGAHAQSGGYLAWISTEANRPNGKIA